MNEMEIRNYEFSRDKALREDIMSGNDRFFMQGHVRSSWFEEHEKLVSSLCSAFRG